MRFSSNKTSSSTAAFARPLTISVPLQHSSSAEQAYDQTWRDKEIAKAAYNLSSGTSLALSSSQSPPTSPTLSNYSTYSSFHPTSNSNFSNSLKSPLPRTDSSSRRMTSLSISQPKLVAGSSFGFSPDSFESNESFSPTSPATPATTQSPKLYHHGHESSPETVKALRSDSPPRVGSYKSYQAQRKSYGASFDDLDHRSAAGVASKGSIRLSRPVANVQRQSSMASPIELRRGNTTATATATPTESKRSSRFPWKRSSMSGPSGGSSDSNHTSSSKPLRSRNSVISISAPVLEYSTSELVSDSRLTMIINSSSQNHHPAPSRPPTDPSTPEMSFPSPNIGSSANENFDSSIAPAVHTSFKTSPRVPAAVNVTPHASVREQSSIFQNHEHNSELKQKLQESEQRRHNLLVEYQQKLDHERKRSMALQKQLEEFSTQKENAFDQQAKIRQLQSQRDVLRKALVNLRETKDMEIKGYRDKLGKDVFGNAHNPSQETARRLEARQQRPSANSSISTIRQTPSLSVTSSVSSYSLSSDTATNTRHFHAANAADFFTSFKVGISPLLPIASPVDLTPKKLRQSAEIIESPDFPTDIDPPPIMHTNERGPGLSNVF